MDNSNEGGQALLAAGERAGATAALIAARNLPATRLAAHNLIERHGLEGSFAQMFGLDCAISPADDIFHFFAGHPTSNNPLRDYLADGWRASISRCARPPACLNLPAATGASRGIWSRRWGRRA